MHVPVLLDETIDFLNVKPDGRYVDGTLGLAGHAIEILKRLGPNGRLLGLDVDPINLKAAEDRLQPPGDQTITRQVSFRGLQGVLQDLGWDGVDGALFDLGVSSSQLDDPERGLSFESKGSLDMRLDPRGAETALDFIQSRTVEELGDVFFKFGLRRFPKKVARYLKADVESGKIVSAQDLSGFCARVIGRKGKTHPATKIFLALRASVNEELEALDELLETAPPLLNVGGRMAIITFHSLEDRAVKKAFLEWAKNERTTKSYTVLTRKPVLPSESEIQHNPRARSAKLRVLERVA